MGIFTDYHGLRPWVVISLCFAWIPPLLLGFMLINDIGGANGHHNCYITSVEDATNLTWDSTLVYTKTDPQASNEDAFCVTDKKIREQLDDAVKNRSRVTIHYRNDLIIWRWECNGGSSIVVGVEESK